MQEIFFIVETSLIISHQWKGDVYDGQLLETPKERLRKFFD
ncbi:hypothetical protein [Nostoc sp.]